MSGPSTVIANRGGAKNVRSTIRTVRAGDIVHVGDATIEAVLAVNPTKTFHPRWDEHVGYVVSVDDRTIYMAGDTDQFLRWCISVVTSPIFLLARPIQWMQRRLPKQPL